MLTASQPLHDTLQSERVFDRLRPRPTSEQPRPDRIEDALGQALAAATLRPSQREAVQRVLLDRLLEAPPAVATFSLSSGLAAIGFALQDTARSLHETLDLGELDDLVLAAVGRPWNGPLGLVDGLCGMAVYGLARAPEPTGVEIVHKVILHLQLLAQLTIRGLVWPTTGADRDGAPAMDLPGGGAGIASTLLAAADAGFARDVALDLVEGHVPWLLDQLEQHATARWMDGSLGPVTVALRAAVVLQRPAWIDRALTAADRLRPALLDAPIPEDASVWSGSGGVLVLLQNLARHTTAPWVSNALARWHTAASATCVRALAQDDPIDWSLATGLGGTIAALHDDEPRAAWRMLVGAHEGDLRHG